MSYVLLSFLTKRNVVLTLLLFTFAALGGCTLSVAPEWFNQHTRTTSDLTRLSLTAPRAKDISGEDHLVYMQKRYQTLQHLTRDVPVASNYSNSSISNSNDKAQSIGYLDYAYYAPLNVSKVNPQTVFVQLDTGSADLWIVSSSCQSQQCTSDKVLKFNEDESSSFQFVQSNQNSTSSTNQQKGGSMNVTVSAQFAQATGNATKNQQQTKRQIEPAVIFAAQNSTETGNTIAFNVVYDDGTAATGALAADVITIANLASPNQVFGLVNNTNVTLQSQGISGVLGMGFPRGSAIARSLIGENVKYSTSPPLTNILSDHNNSYPLFSLLLNQTGGILTLGAADPEILSTDEEIGQVEWFDVYPFPSGNTAQALNASVNEDAASLGSYLYWALELSAAGYDGQSVNVSSSYGQPAQNSLALFDSGAPGIVGPIDQVAALFNQIDGARHVGDGRYVVPCTTQGRMFFSFGGRNYTFLPTDYMIGEATGNPYLCLAWPAASQASSDGIDWVLGQPFLRAQYSMYSLGIVDREPPKIGLYPLRAEANSTNSSSVFQDESEASISSFLSLQTPIATTLPNSLVPVIQATSTPAYVFANATSTASIGLIPTSAGEEGIIEAAPQVFSALLTATTGNTKLPILSNPVSNLPVPSNPAERESNGSQSIHFKPYSILIFIAIFIAAFTFL